MVDNIDSLHELAITAVKAQQYPQALQALQTLVRLQPESAIVHNHLANVLKKLGHFEESETAYQQALQLDPRFADAYNNLGILYFTQGDLEKAERSYQQALAISPDFIDALYNLGLCHLRKNKDDASLECFEKLLKVTPNHLAAHYHLGKIYFKQNQVDQAIQQFTAVLAINEKIPELHSNLANCYLKQEQWAQARIHYEKSLDLDPNNFEACYNLAIVSEEFANIDLAIQYYQKACQINLHDFATHNNLGIAYLKRQNLGFALKHFEIALNLQPGNENLCYNINAIKQDKRLEAAPTNYIKNLFNNYAEHFEKHIQESLDYQVPEKLLMATKISMGKTWIPAFAGTTALRRSRERGNPGNKASNLKQHHYNILDLGCGTGLASELFKPYAKRLVGIDLSENMIDVAKAKNIYDELIVADIENYLQTQTASFDIILAADVFVYIGKLENVIAQCHTALKQKGLLVFSSEICEHTDYQILQSGRFAHSEMYLKKLAKQHRFKVIYHEIIQARMQYDKPVMGQVMVMRKKRLF